MKLTLQTLWEEGAESLRRSGIGEAELDAKYLLLKRFRQIWCISSCTETKR